MSDIVEALADVVGGAAVSAGDAIHDDYTHDEALTATAQRPLAVVRPATTADVARVVELAAATRACRSPREVRAPASPARASPSRVASSCRSSA